MRWTVFFIFALFTVAMENSLMRALAYGGAPDSAVQPSLVAPLAVFVALLAPRLAALAACLTLGVLLDLKSWMAVYDTNDTVRLIGPYALGYVFGCALVLQLRTMVFRRRSLTIGVLTAAMLLAVNLVVVTLLVIRSWYPEPALQWSSGSPLEELGRRAFTAAYSGLVAIPVGWMLLRSMPLWGFRGFPLGPRGRAWR